MSWGVGGQQCDSYGSHLHCHDTRKYPVTPLEEVVSGSVI